MTMRYLKGLLSAVGLGVALMAFGVSAHAQQEPTLDDRQIATREISKIAFTPEAFFPGDESGPRGLRVVYRGDDYGWPVWALAVRFGCEGSREPGCHRHWRARAVLAPPPPNANPMAQLFLRPRSRGSSIVAKAVRLRASDPDRPWPSIVGELGLAWLETDHAACPRGTTALARVRDVKWISPWTVPPALNEEEERKPPPIYLHPDRLQIRLGSLSTTAVADEIGAAVWARELFATLQTCFTPSTAERPW